MHLRAFVSEKFHVLRELNLRKLRYFCTWVSLSDSDIEKRERVIQTYLVVFSLLLSYEGGPDLKKILIESFLTFLFYALIYYALLLTRTFIFAPFTFWLPTVVMSFHFANAVVACVVSAGGSVPRFLAILIILSIALPLVIPISRKRSC